jgi:PAS domain S-box-containing protein
MHRAGPDVFSKHPGYAARIKAPHKPNMPKATKRQDEQDPLRDIARARRLLSESARVLVRAKDEAIFLQEMCSIAVELAGYKLAWIGLLRHDEARSIEAVGLAYDQYGVFGKVLASWGDSDLGKGPAGTAVRSGHAQVVQNLHGAHNFGNWLPLALGPLHRAVAALPLRIEGDTGPVVGVLCLVAGEALAFDTLELELLEEVARDIAFGMHAIRVRGAQLQTHAALRLSEQRYKITFDHASVGIGHVGADGRYILANRQLEKILGYGPGELIGKSVREMVHPEDIALTDDMRARMHAGQTDSFKTQKRYFKKDGATVWVALNVSMMRDDQDSPLYAISVVEDITERVRATALRELEHTITLQLLVTDSASATLQTAMRAICESEHWDCARYFEPREAPGVLHCSESWSGKDALTAEFLRASKQISHAADKGLFGLACKQGRPAWSTDMNLDGHALEKTLSQRHGMRSEYVFPVWAEGAIIGLLVFNSRKSTAPEQNLLDAVEAISAQIGHILRHKKTAETQRRFRVALDTSADMVTLIDPATMRYLDVNTTACEKKGYTREQMLTMGPHEVSDVSHSEFAREFAQTIASGGTTRLINSARCKDGRKFPVEVLLRALKSEGRWLIVAVLRDISARVESEQTLRHSEARFRTLVSLSSDSLWETDSEHRFTNIVHGSHFPVSSRLNSKIGKMRWGIPSVSPGLSGWEWLRQTMDAHQPFHGFEFARADDNGQIDYRMISGEPVFAEDGQFTGYLGIARDLTPAKRDEARLLELNSQLEERVEQRTADLERANKELETFSYSVAHDLRAPLRAINAFSAIVLEENQGKLDPASVGNLKRVQEGGLRMSELVDDLLDLARISRQPLLRQDIDLSRLANKTLAALAEDDTKRQIEIRLDAPMRGNGDSGLLEVVLANLIGNAWKFTSKVAAARIDIGTEEHDGRQVYFVGDNGAGFDMTYSPKLFTPFQRLHSRNEFEGAGIGLSLVKRIIEKHGGTVWAEGEKDKGARFYFTLC